MKLQSEKLDQLPLPKLSCPKCFSFMGRSGQSFVCVKCAVEFDQNLKVISGVKKGLIKSERQEIDGYTFGSGVEACAYSIFKLQERSGLISNIRCQQTLQLLPTFTHKIDFIVFDNERGFDVGREVKGSYRSDIDPRWQAVKQVYRSVAPIRIQIWTGDKKRVSLTEEIPVGKYQIVEKS